MASAACRLRPSTVAAFANSTWCARRWTGWRRGWPPSACKCGEATAAERSAAEAALAAGAKLGARTPLSQLIDADVAFHSAIHVLSGNRAIVETVADQWPHFRRSMGLVLSVSGAHARYWDEHAAILEAILAGDARAAEERARRHTAAAGEETARRLEQSNSINDAQMRPKV